ncbi:hypothetical protein QVD17_04115 [Tagetes erecta]|uniref:VTT domain-containing protein n=1 Tax=Tagetes erecta TaxID=13708 RepID=A0AAD8LEX7_TARER|nr:hypothetical protein QVD17_04115 [Tagetes erecta]
MEQQQHLQVESTSRSSSSSCSRPDHNHRENNVKSSTLSACRFPLTFRETAAACGVVLVFALGLIGIYLSLPDSDYSFLKFPKTLEDLRLLRDNLERYTMDYTMQVLVGYCAVYIFMLTFMIPGTVFMSLLAGSLFGVFKGVAVVVFAATAGASCCYFLSNLIGRPLILSFWPDQLVFFQNQVAKRKSRLLNYMIFLRVTPTLPSAFISVASPLVDVPYHTFVIATSLGIIPIAFVTVRVHIVIIRSVF